MKAAQLLQPRTVVEVETPVPVPAAEEVLFRVETCGVCASNLPPWDGRPWFDYPFPPGALGHEASGTIIKVGHDVSGWEAGQRITALSYHSYAEYDVAKADALVLLPESARAGVFLGEPLGCAINIFRRAQVEAGQTVAIVGIGFLGALLIQLATARGARVLALARRPDVLAQAEKMGATPIQMEDRYAAVEQVKARTNGKFCPVVIEATGKQEPLHLAGEITAERGRLVIAGYHQDGLREINLQLWNWRGLDVINAHERDQKIYVQGMQDALHAVLSGEMQPQALITHRFPLGRLAEALRLTAERPPGFMKAVIEF